MSNITTAQVRGRWSWDREKESFQRESRKKALSYAKMEAFTVTNNFKFSTNFDEADEHLFQQEFQRPSTTYDSDSILIQDVKNVVAFFAPAKVLTASLIDFINTETANAFLKALIMYFEYYLKIVEFILIERDELAAEDAQILSTENMDMRRVYSAHLQQYRLLLAREYSRIILGDGDVKKFYHLKPIVNISQTSSDKRFHESLLAFCTQAIWITMHRRAYDVIDMEMNRLFRSEHFKLTRYPRVEFKKPESQILYGPNYKRSNYRIQCSPLIQELNNISQHNLPILSIGKQKYNGTDLRIKRLEMEFMVDAAHLVLIGVSFGILGHPKELYSTNLKLDWEEVRKHNFSKSYDPYGIFTQPHLKIPTLNEEKLRVYAETYKPGFNVKCQLELWTPEMLRKWKIRDKFIRQFKAKDAFTGIWAKCSKEVGDTSYALDVKEIVKRFIADKTKHRKLRQKEILVKAEKPLSDNK
uniref:Protein phosphatase 1 regulatory subunit 36 n=1 Tax=Glossina austeni TaxID=7395 RepID=A0A1A9VVM7_GLOAU